jgi:YgiT-type zinc finger domain-containing protein
MMATPQKIPKVGDVVVTEGKRMGIVEMVGRRISKVKLEKLPQPTEENKFNEQNSECQDLTIQARYDSSPIWVVATLVALRGVVGDPMTIKLKIKKCPTCGSGQIKKGKKDLRGEYQSKKYSVPSLSFYECLNCGEKVYDREVIRRIEEKSPRIFDLFTINFS